MEEHARKSRTCLADKVYSDRPVAAVSFLTRSAPGVLPSCLHIFTSAQALSYSLREQ